MKSYKYLLVPAFFLTAVSNILAAGEEANETLYSVAKIMVVLTLLSILLVFWLVIVYSEKNDNKGDLFLAPFKKMIAMITKSTPIEKEHEILLDHDYDGIRELDNKIPPWFHGLLWGTIIFAFVYMVQYHIVGDGDIQTNEYLEEINKAAVEREILIRTGAFLNEETVTLTLDAGALNSGKEIYLKNCSACHGMVGEGLVGPNLTDEYWIHGGGVKNIFKVIKYGVPQKGMISWQTQLNPTQIKEVSSFIISIEGTNPANGKEPEGNKWVEETVNTSSGS